MSVIKNISIHLSAGTVLLTIFTIIAVGLLLGDGTPVYDYPFAGQGLLKPWLNWTTADRWRLDKLEAIAYEKVQIEVPRTSRLTS
jgi:hypothetical protein